MTNALDDALQAICRTAPDLTNGNSNHAPMVAETLVRLGRGDIAVSWVEGYCRQEGTHERPAVRPRLQGDWREGLGKPDLWSEWVSLFRHELTEQPWRDVLDPWTARLAPGLSGEATHGLIRTAHAARALGEEVTEPRLNELADALAYWAATYHDFGPASPRLQHFPLEQALDQLPEIDPPVEGNVAQALKGLDGSTAFSGAINLLGTGHEPLDDLSTLTARFAMVYLANAQDPSRTFAVVHAVTGPSSLRLLAPYVTKSTRELLLLYAWQAAAAIYAIWGKNRAPAEVAWEPTTRDDLTGAAISNGAAHAIKLVEACLREYEYNPAPVFLTAASDGATRLSG